MKHKLIILTTLALLFPVLPTLGQTVHGWRNVRPSADGAAASKQLQKKGLRAIKTQGDTLRLSDRFADLPCEVAIPRNSENDYTAAFIITFPDRWSWAGLLNEFDSIEKALVEQFGAPSYTHKEFQNESIMHRRPNKYQDVIQGLCTWRSDWDTDKTGVHLWIESATDTTRTYTRLLIENH